jgi:hypothetical protein
LRKPAASILDMRSDIAMANMAFELQIVIDMLIERDPG